MDLVHVTGPLEIHETTLPDHRVVAHLDGPSRTRFWCAGTGKAGECVPGDICIFPATSPFSVRRNRQGRIVATFLNPEAGGRSRERRAGSGATGAPADVPGAESPAERAAPGTRGGGPDRQSQRSALRETLGAAVAAQLLRTQLLARHERRGAGGLDSLTLRRVFDYVEAHLAEQIRLSDLAALAGMSTFQLARRFKDATGFPPYQHVTRRRIERAKQLLCAPDSSVLDVAIACGFASPSHFARAFHFVTGVTPRSFRGASAS